MNLLSFSHSLLFKYSLGFIKLKLIQHYMNVESNFLPRLFMWHHLIKT